MKKTDTAITKTKNLVPDIKAAGVVKLENYHLSIDEVDDIKGGIRDIDDAGGGIR
ncbi:hypothetical protein [Bacillus manliponensis]|uniref:hypothetical protein n=1 Tax=Bacillus manliponensis TaxID=574376 RepID=UPI0035156DDE